MWYSEYESVSLGISDIGKLILVGYDNDKGFIAMPIKFGDDGEYFAYLADEDVEMPESCECIASFNRWFKIYDDEQVTYTSEHLLGRVGKIYKTPIPYTIIIQTPRKKTND